MTSASRDTFSPDLEITVRLSAEPGRTRLSYELDSPTGVAPFAHRRIPGPEFMGTPEELHQRMLQQIEGWGDGVDVGGALVLRSEIERRLNGLGRSLWQQLFSDELRLAYHDFRDRVKTVLIVSD